MTGETLNPALVATAFTATQTFDHDNRLLTHNGAATTFDADGNLLTIASGVAPASYTYDARNRLTAAGGLTYTYDAENRRVGVTNAVGTTTFVVNPLPALDQVLVRTLPDGTKTFYVYGLGLLHEQTGSTVRYYHHDRRGGTVVMTDGSGVVTDRVAYGIYGEILSRSGTTNTPFLFNGRWGVQTDANELYYHRARYYHPSLRRFLNQDSVLGSVGDSASLNRFAYANGNPVSLIDPFGLAAMDAAPNSESLAWGVTKAAFGGAGGYLKSLLWTGPKGLVTGAYHLVTSPIATTQAAANGLGTFAGNLAYNTGGHARGHRECDAQTGEHRSRCLHGGNVYGARSSC